MISLWGGVGATCVNYTNQGANITVIFEPWMGSVPVSLSLVFGLLSNFHLSENPEG